MNEEWDLIDLTLQQFGFSTSDLIGGGKLEYVLSKSNKQTALLYLQSKHIRQLKEQGLIWEFSFLELENILQELFTLQGKTERIKNFPYPRQYASLSYYFVQIFILFLPFAIYSPFEYREIHKSVVSQ